MHQRARVRVGLAPEIEQAGKGVAGGAGQPERIVPAVEELPHARKLAHGVEDVQEVVALAAGGVLLKEQLLLVAGAVHARGVRPGEERRVEKLIVFEEPDEHARQHPRDGDLRDLLVTPGVEGFRRALALPRRRILRLERGVDLRLGVASSAQVFLQQRDALLEGGEE